MMSEKIEVPNEVIEALILIREQGKYNMLQSDGVVYEMFKKKMHGPVIWLTETSPSGKVKVISERYIAAIKELDSTLKTLNELSRSV